MHASSVDDAIAFVRGEGGRVKNAKEKRERFEKKAVDDLGYML